MKKYPPKNIYLIGFMGSGKSTVGPLLAEKLDHAFFDTDECIVNETGKSIPEIFAEDGEDFFREKEREAIQFVSQLENFVVSVGGGAVMNTRNWLALKSSGLIIYLKCDAESIYQRVKNDLNRPLLNKARNKREQISVLLNQRAHTYEQADLIIDTANLTPESVVQKIVQEIE
jgi:shikimate kinase